MTLYSIGGVSTSEERDRSICPGEYGYDTMLSLVRHLPSGSVVADNVGADPNKLVPEVVKILRDTVHVSCLSKDE